VKPKRILYGFISLFVVASVALFNVCVGKVDFPVLKGPYLGQKPPGMIPKLFAPGIVSTGIYETSLVFSPDGKLTCYNLMHLSHRYTAIVCMEQKNGRWTKPEVAGFSGKFHDSDAFFSLDGQKLYFCADRPQEKQGKAGNIDIWVVEPNQTGWSHPKNLGAAINSEYIDVNPCLTRDGTMYFASNRPGGKGYHDLYRSRLIDGTYTNPENLGDSINTANFESSPYVSPDESFMIFNVFATKKGETKSGLHISFRTTDGSWSRAIFMGEVINDLKPAMFAFVTPDGKYLFFTSAKVPYLPYTGKALSQGEIIEMFNAPQNGSGDIYWVDAKIIEALKPINLK
jgi:hypothetical protein